VSENVIATKPAAVKAGNVYSIAKAAEARGRRTKRPAPEPPPATVYPGTPAAAPAPRKRKPRPPTVAEKRRQARAAAPAPAATAEPLRVLVLADPRVTSPDSPHGTGKGHAVEIGDALTREWPSDAHLTAYEPVDRPFDDGTTAPIRLARGAIGAVPIRMTLAIGDVDDREAHATRTPASEAWRAEVEPRLNATGLFWYRTRGGARVLGPLAEPFLITSAADAAAWTARYLAWLDALRAEHGLELDRSCADWTRLYRLPNVLRDGAPQRADLQGGEAPRVVLPAAEAPAPSPAPSPAPPDREPTAAERDQVARAVAAVAPFYAPGERHPLGRAIAGYLRHKGLPRAAAVDLLDAVASETGSDVATARARVAWAFDAANPDGASTLRARWPALLAELDAIFRDPIVAEMAARRDARAAAGAGAGDDRPGPLILTRKSDGGAVFVDHGPDRGGYQPVDAVNVPRVLADMGLIPDFIEGRRAEPPRALINRLGRLFTRAAYDFRERLSRYDEATDTLVIGYPVRPVPARFDARADAWLRALGGDEYPRLAAWVASCGQANIGRLAAALVVIGPADTGKTLLSHVVAGLWGEEPIGAGLLLDRFNDDLRRCPILCDDEADLVGSGALSTKRFRTAMQATERSIEPKGRERTRVRGALRLIITANDVSDLRFTDVGGGDVLRAVADRILVIDCKPRAGACVAALETLKRPDDDRVDLAVLVSHAAWLVEGTAIPRGRFVSGGGAASAAAVLAGTVAGEATLWATLADWLDCADPDAATGAARAWLAVEGALCVDARALAEALGAGDRQWTLPRVLRALAPFGRGQARPRLGEGYRPRLQRLDWLDVAAAVGLDEGQAAELAQRVAAARGRGVLCPAWAR